MRIRVWYHSACYDGFGAAWAARRALGTGCEFVPCAYGDPLPPFEEGDQIYIVDFSWPRDVLVELAKKVELTVLDHHKTAEEALRGLDFAHFDMNRSGAGLTWDHFFPKSKRPTLIELIEDRDLWRYRYPATRSFHAYILSEPFDFERWDHINHLLQQEPWTVLNKGEAMLVAQAQLVTKICSKAWLGMHDGNPVAMVNTASHWSEVGEELLRKFPEAHYAASFTIMNNGGVMWSLRSRGDYDVSAVAKSHGGGGHAAAAGYKTKTTDFSHITWEST